MLLKPLLILPDTNLTNLSDRPATGMDFHVIKVDAGFLAVLGNGPALPLYADHQFYCLDDLLAGEPVPTQRMTAPKGMIQQIFPNRFAAVTALRAANISLLYTGASGAFPLIATATLKTDTVFCRYGTGPTDRRYAGGGLSTGTYLTSELDAAHADTGFGAVGRYALPIPLPANQVFRYELPAGTKIEIGTVGPNFGQAGGGVEVRLPNATSAKQVSSLSIADY